MPAVQSVGPLQLVLQPLAFELQANAPHEVTSPQVVSEPFEQVMAVHWRVLPEVPQGEYPELQLHPPEPSQMPLATPRQALPLLAFC